MKIIKTPWMNEFLTMTQKAKSHIRIISPYIKEGICDELLSKKKSKTKLSLVTSFKLANLYSGSLDLGGIEKLINAGAVAKNHPKIHAKTYLFDDEKAVITSGNLTFGGMLNNYEYGVLIEDKSFAKKIASDFDTLFADENTSTIKRSDIFTVKGILSAMPSLKKSKIAFPHFDDIGVEAELKIHDESIISNNLSGWKKHTFLVLNKIQKQVFSLEDVYQYESEFEILYLKNKNIKDKLRQQLQVLRDIGLIEFLGTGQYRKLWRLEGEAF